MTAKFPTLKELADFLKQNGANALELEVKKDPRYVDFGIKYPNFKKPITSINIRRAEVGLGTCALSDVNNPSNAFINKQFPKKRTIRLSGYTSPDLLEFFKAFQSARDEAIKAAIAKEIAEKPKKRVYAGWDSKFVPIVSTKNENPKSENFGNPNKYYKDDSILDEQIKVNVDVGEFTYVGKDGKQTTSRATEVDDFRTAKQAIENGKVHLTYSAAKGSDGQPLNENNMHEYFLTSCVIKEGRLNFATTTNSNFGTSSKVQLTYAAILPQNYFSGKRQNDNSDLAEDLEALNVKDAEQDLDNLLGDGQTQ